MSCIGLDYNHPEAYPGELEDIDYLAALLLPLEQPYPLLEILGRDDPFTSAEQEPQLSLVPPESTVEELLLPLEQPYPLLEILGQDDPFTSAEQEPQLSLAPPEPTVEEIFYPQEQPDQPLALLGQVESGQSMPITMPPETAAIELLYPVEQPRQFLQLGTEAEGEGDQPMLPAPVPELFYPQEQPDQSLDLLGQEVEHGQSVLSPIPPESATIEALVEDAIYPNVNATERDGSPLHPMPVQHDNDHDHDHEHEHEQHEHEHEHEQQAERDLESCLRDGDWEPALQHLDRMVRQGEAENSAVQTDAPPNNIYKNHPEVVLRLRGQILFDMLQEGHIAPALLYYETSIQALYPDGTSTGCSFADDIMESIRDLLRTGQPHGGNDFVDGGEKTRVCVEDYLKVYFPAYRPQLEPGTTRVWEFGVKYGQITRCLVCHKQYKGSYYKVRQLRYHLVGLAGGRQGRCHGVIPYVKGRLDTIMADEGYDPQGNKLA